MEFEKSSDKGIFILFLIFSLVIFLVVACLSQLSPSTDLPSYIHWLPRINALLNGSASVLLIISFISIKRKKSSCTSDLI